MEALAFWGVILAIYLIFSIMANWDAIVEAIIGFFIAVIRIAAVIGGIWLFLLFMGEMIKLHGGNKVFSFIIFAALVFGLIYFLYHFRNVFENIFVSIKNKLSNIVKTVKKAIKPPPLPKPHLHKFSEPLPEIREEKKIDEEVLKRLLKHGADINATDNNGNTILHKTIKAGQINATRLLIIHGAKLDIKNSFGKTPFEMATSKQMEKYLSIKNAILSGDAERTILLINAQKQISDSAMHYAAIRGNIEIASLLLEKGIDLESKDESGNTAIVLAVTYNQPKFLEWLIEHGANTDVKVENNKGLLHIAAIYGYDEIIKTLVATGLNVDDKDDDGHSSLWYAKKYGNYTTLKILKSHSKMLLFKKVLVWLIFIMVIVGGFFAFLQYPNPLKNKVYLYSIDRGYLSIADFLAKTPIDNEKHKINKLKKMITSKSYDEKIFRYLIKSLDINQTDKDGKTLLHYIYEQAPVNILSIVKKYNPNENIKDNLGKKPCVYSIYNSDLNITICPEACEGNNTTICNELGDKYYEEKNYIRAKQIFTVTCDNNSSYGCFKMGKLFDIGNGVKKSLKKATELYKKSCIQGYPSACENVSSIADNLYMNDHYYKDAISLYRLSCDSNITKSCVMLGIMYQRGDGVQKNRSKAKHFLKKSQFSGDNFFNLAKKLHNEISEDLYVISCSKDYKKACTTLAGDYYQKGLFVEALKFYKKSCNLGDTMSCAHLGVMYKYGEGTKKNNDKAVYYLKKATASDLSLLALSMPSKKSEDLYLEACKKDDKFSCEKIVAIAYENHNKNNYKKAFKLYDLGCKHDISWGCNNLGVMYDNGQWVKQNHKQAVKLFKKACNNGYFWACNNLGLKYQSAQGVYRDNTKAMNLYSKACNGGIAQACYNLGNMYQYNYSKSQELYQKACSGGYKEACPKVSPVFNWQNNAFPDKNYLKNLGIYK